ncbi:MAG: iron-sulfur cluster repair di-iron protein [Bacteroidetes bacterium]|nr:iron-sulfur cluster repair di-iron protein [Bacteroidota bacterium]
METVSENILNVTLLEPREKHPTIFARFDILNEGESLTIHNDHDPKPLYYQMLGERGNVFTWEYLEEGPEWWKVRISKKISGSKDETLGQIAAKDLRKALVFKKYGIDFCCGGKKTVKEACAEKGLDITQIEKELQETEKTSANSNNLPFNDWSIDFLSDYIVNTHHTYVRKNLPELVFYSNKVSRVHGDRHPELLRINQCVEEINAELNSHMQKEEIVLFPYIKQLVNSKNTNQPLEPSHFGTVKGPINMMEMEHEFVGKHYEEIKKLTVNYSLPADACMSYSMLYRLLQEFENDLNIHIHLENNILFPKAIELEKELSNH